MEDRRQQINASRRFARWVGVASCGGGHGAKFRVAFCIRASEPAVTSRIPVHANEIGAGLTEMVLRQGRSFKAHAAQPCELLIRQPGRLPARDGGSDDGIQVRLAQRMLCQQFRNVILRLRECTCNNLSRENSGAWNGLDRNVRFFNSALPKKQRIGTRAADGDKRTRVPGAGTFVDEFSATRERVVP